MHTITHIYFSYLFLPQTKIVALGAIFPDTHIFSPLSYSKTHSNNASLVAFMRKKNPVMVSFAQSALLHEKLDYLGDRNWEGSNAGYCFIQGKKILDLVKKSFRTEDDAFALVKAHTFIEMAIQLLLVQGHRYLCDRFRSAMQDEALIDEIVLLLGEYYSLEPSVLKKAFKDFSAIIEYENPTYETMIEKYNTRNMVKNNKTIEMDVGVSLLKRAVEIVKSEYFPLSIDKLSIFAKCRHLVEREGFCQLSG